MPTSRQACLHNANEVGLGYIHLYTPATQAIFNTTDITIVDFLQYMADFPLHLEQRTQRAWSVHIDFARSRLPAWEVGLKPSGPLG